MDDDAAAIPDTTELRKVLAPALLPQFTRILAHAQVIRAWAVQSDVLSDAERTTLLEQLSALERAAQALSADYAALQPSPSPPDGPPGTDLLSPERQAREQLDRTTEQTTWAARECVINRRK